MSTTYRNRAVFTWPMDWSALPSGRIEYDANEVALGFGPVAFYGDQNYTVQGWQFQVGLDSAEAIDAFDAFTAALQGRLTGFWFPTPVAAFQIVANVSATQCNVSAAGLASTWADHAGVFVWFTKDGQAPKGAKVTGVVDNGDGTERVTFEESVSVDATWQAWRLAYVRLADDTEEAEFLAEGRQVRTVKVIELAEAYTLIELGEQPIYLYELSIGSGDDEVFWRWTSFPAGQVIEDEVWLARRVSHGRIEFDLTGARQGVTLLVDREIADSPLPTALPPWGCQPIKVRLREANYPDLPESTVLFAGVVSQVSVSGRTLQVRCASWLTHTKGAVPAFLFGGRCPYRLFDADTCRLTAAGFACTATVSALNGRQVTLTGASLAGKAANWFAEGWLTVGAGLQREVRLVLSNGTPTNNAIVFHLNAPLRWAADNAEATVVPGCDGRMTTCQDKFANRVNYGGHRWASGNLALKAIPVKPPNLTKK